MRFPLVTLLLALLPSLVAVAASRPRTAHQFDARFKGLMVHRVAAPVIARSASDKGVLLTRQSTDCTTTCSSASDETAINGFDACATNDVTCECTYLEEISSTCLTCLLSGTGYTLQSLCSSGSGGSAGGGSTTTACETQCADAQDQTANEALTTCTSQELSNPCVCEALEAMTTTCLACLLTASDISTASYEQSCGSTSSSVPLGGSSTAAVPTVPAGTSSAAGASATGIAACQTSSCTSASDTSSLTAAEACSSNDDTCICTNLLELSSTCLSCVVTALGFTQAQFAQVCPAAGFSASGSSSAASISTGSATRTSLSLASTVPAAGATPSSTGTFSSCSSNSACTDTIDQSAISQGNSCSATDYVCTCKALGELSSSCLTCVLAAAGYTESFYQSSCAAVSASVASATRTTSSSASTQTSTRSSGMKDLSVNSAFVVAVGAFALILV